MAGGFQTIMQFHGGCAAIGIPYAFTADLHQCVGFLRSGCEDTSRTMELKRSSHDSLPIREERGGKGVALISIQFPAIERKPQVA